MKRFLFFAFAIYVTAIFSCTHDPIYSPPDTTDLTGNEPCDPDIIYYEKDIQPILNSSCAYVGCHDANTAEHNVDLSSYTKALREVEPGRLKNSELYEVITTSNPGKRMPPSGKLPAELIGPIEKWILQGAKNLTCDQSATNCNIEGSTYSGAVKGIMSTYCYGCHSGSNPLGRIRLDSYETVKASANNGSLYGSIAWVSGYQRMPDGLPKLDDCNINKVKNWIDNGAQNN
ncbi:MAG: hypothetical protein KDC49_17640 [Saprospiraceae bacterium]|nr:hypothetical protein [Saprospiraceae bacterium]